jgi:hypothetical protein
MVFMFLGLVVTKDGDMWAKQCDSPTFYEHMHGFGFFQGIFLIFFFLCSMFWWGMQAIDLFQRLILGYHIRAGSSNYNRRAVGMHLFCWGVPFICVVGLVVGHQIGYDSYLPFAFIAADLSMLSQPIQLHYVFFFIPLLAMALLCYVLVGIVLVYLVRYDTTGGLKKFQDSMEKSKSFWFKFSQALKLFGFALLMLMFIIIYVIFEITITNGKDGWDDALQRWGESLMTNYTGTATIPPITDRFPPSMIILTVFGFCSPGFFMFLLYFCFSSEIYGLWFGVLHFKLGLTWFKSLAREDTVTGTGSSGSGGSSNGSSAGTGKKSNTTTTDLLTSGETALKTRRHAESIPRAPENLEPLPTASSASAITPPAPKRNLNVNPVEQQQKRTALFKGFKSNNVPLPPPNRASVSVSSAPTMPAANSDPNSASSPGFDRAGHSVELTNMSPYEDAPIVEEETNDYDE